MPARQIDQQPFYFTAQEQLEIENNETYVLFSAVERVSMN
jgi:hypothetical protein